MTLFKRILTHRLPTWLGIVGACSLASCAARDAAPTVQAPRTAPTAEPARSEASIAPATNLATEEARSLTERWGIAPLGIQRSAAGYVLDFRYRVTDPEKARPFLDRRLKPYLTDAAGRRLVVPTTAKVGPLRQIAEEPQRDRVYFILFGNPGRAVQDGDLVSLMVAETQAAELIVGGDPATKGENTF